MGEKVPKWQSGYYFPNSHFGTFSLPIDFKKIFFMPNDSWLSVMKDILRTFSHEVSLAQSRPVHVLIREDKLDYFKFPLWNFKNYFLFWVAGIVLKALEVELEPAISFAV